MTTTLDTTTTARTYVIDKTHSEVAFQVRHLLTKVRGRFSDFTGSIVFDQEHPERSSASLTIDASSIDTGTPDRDTHLRSDDFFAVKTYPTLTFTELAGRQDRGRYLRRDRHLDDSRHRQGDHAAGYLSRNGEGPVGQRAGQLRGQPHAEPEGLRFNMERRA